MGPSAREPLAAQVPERVRRQELIRPAERRREFAQREAQRHLQRKETHWAPIAYAVFLIAIAVIFFMAYTSYAFSKYRGEVLPGTYVDQLRLGGLTEKQAERLITNETQAIHLVPVQLTYHGLSWNPKSSDLGLYYYYGATARAAMAVGRQGSIIGQWIDRLPIHPDHTVPLLYHKDEKRIRAYIASIAANRSVQTNPQNAVLQITSATAYHVTLTHSRPGTRLDVAAAEQAVDNALGSLTVQSQPLHVYRIQPAITDAAAIQVQKRVEAMLTRPPVIGIGKRVFPTSRRDIGPMLSFAEGQIKGRPAIILHVDPNQVRAFVAALASQVDRPALDAKLNFVGGQVQVIRPQQNGRSLNQDAAYQSLLRAVTALKPNARLRFAVSVTQPPIDQQNPASLGIRRLIGTAATSFAGAGPTRMQDIEAIARSFNQYLVSPTQDISFNTIVGSNWPARMYSDRATESNGQLVPGNSGAMQQVATTFLRALFAAGLTLEERHAHLHRLPWYEPPVGLDAVVAPGRAWDLRFANSTNKYLLIETQVQPIRQELYIYVYGPNLGWKVSVDPQGKVLKVLPHGPQIERQDPSLAPGEVQQISWPLNGARTVVQRTITFPSGKVQTDSISTTYQPSAAIITVGSAAPTPTPTSTTGKKKGATSSPTATPQPTPSPTFNH